jgi:hypothetical protein
MKSFIYRPNQEDQHLFLSPSVAGLGGIMEPHNPMQPATGQDLPATDYPVTTAYYVNQYQEPNFQPAQAPIESPIISSALLNPVENVRHHKGYGMAYTPTALNGGASDAANMLSFANLFLR